MVKLKLQWFGHLMQRTDSLKRPWCCERLKAGGEGDDRGWDDWMASLTQWTWVWASSRSWWLTGKPGMLQSIGHKDSDMNEWLNWTEMNLKEKISLPRILCPPKMSFRNEDEIKTFSNEEKSFIRKTEWKWFQGGSWNIRNEDRTTEMGNIIALFDGVFNNTTKMGRVKRSIG